MFIQLFDLANPATFFWLILIFLPTWSLTRWIASRNIFPIYLAVLYTISMITVVMNEGFGFVSNFGSAAGVLTLMTDPRFAILCWIHILCFDQAIGHVIYHDNMKHRYIPLPIQSMILFATLMFGPLGFLCYQIIKIISKYIRKKDKSPAS